MRFKPPVTLKKKKILSPLPVFKLVKIIGSLTVLYPIIQNYRRIEVNWVFSK